MRSSARSHGARGEPLVKTGSVSKTDPLVTVAAVRPLPARREALQRVQSLHSPAALSPQEPSPLFCGLESRSDALGPQDFHGGGAKTEEVMSTTMWVVLIVVLFVMFGGGGGYYWSRRGR